jgi:hypothetical protein
MEGKSVKEVRFSGKIYRIEVLTKQVRYSFLRREEYKGFRGEREEIWILF